MAALLIFFINFVSPHVGRADVGVGGEGRHRGRGAGDGRTGNTCQRDIAGGDFCETLQTKAQNGKAVHTMRDRQAAIVRESLPTLSKEMTS